MDERVWYYLAAAIAAFLAARERKRRVRMRGQRAKLAADGIGARFADDGEGLKSRRFWKLPAFRKLGEASLRNIVRVGDSIVFQLYEDLEQDERGMTVAAVRVPDALFPSFEICPRKTIGPLKKWLDRGEIAIDDPIFSECFRLTGVSENRIRLLFGAALRSELMEWKGYSVQGSDRWIVVFREGERLAPTDLPSFLGRASELARHFQDSLAA